MTQPLYVAFDSVQDREAKLLAGSKYLTRYFCEECGFRPLPWMQRKFKTLLENGWDVPMLESVIESTSMAPRPSWAYLAAIIRNSDEAAESYIGKGFSNDPLPK